MSDDPNAWVYEQPEGSEAEVFIQWKGTEVCLDFWCTCGAEPHYDGYFAHQLQCPACGAVWRLGTAVVTKRVDPNDGYVTSPPQMMEADDQENNE